MRRILATMILFALAGCASSGMEQAECQTANWRAIGYEDGALGLGPDAFGTRRKACAEHGIAAKFAAYRAGHGEGLEVFCDPYNGYRLGTGGYRYGGVCPARLEGPFLAAHADGHGLFERQSAVTAIGNKLKYSKVRINQIEHLVVDKTAHLVSPTLSPAQRAATTIELKQLFEEKAELEGSLHQLERDYAKAEREYEKYRREIAARP